MLAIFGPTAVGKTGVAIAIAEKLRERGEDPVAVNCDSIQVYRGLETISGAATAAEQARLEHRLLGFIEPSEEFSAGRYAELAHREIDALLAAGRRPIVVGGTGLYLRAALSELDLRPPVPAEIRAGVEAELAARGPEALRSELEDDVAEGVHPADRKRIARLVELQRAGIQPAADSEQLWAGEMRHPGVLVGLTVERALLAARIDARVEEMAAAGAAEEACAFEAAGASRTALAAIGLRELAAGDLEAVKAAHRRYARRQLVWMRKMVDEASAASAASAADARLIDRDDRDDADLAAEIVAALD
ncbi:MAG: tRNA dimethylallyltransferase [Solirubrobacterales bacterium]|nr:tRNA dimethylallyltransferase [Solirubrobacterales bacterium]